MLLLCLAILRYLPFIQIGRRRVYPAFTKHIVKPRSALKVCLQLVSRLLAAGADPNLANMSGFTALDVSLGAARRTLEAVTTHLTDPALLKVVLE